MPDIFEIVGEELGELLEPVALAAEDPRALELFLQQLGVTTDAVGGAALASALGAVADLRRQLLAVAAQESPSLADIGMLLDAARRAFDGLRALSASDGPAAAFAALAGDAVELMVAGHLRRHHPLLFFGASLLGLVEVAGDQPLESPVVDANDNVVRDSFSIDRFRLHRLGPLLRDPWSALRAEYGASLARDSDAAGVADKLFPRVRRLLDVIGVRSSYGLPDEDRALLGDAARFIDRALLVYFTDPLRSDDGTEAGIVFSFSSAERGNFGLVGSPFGTIAFSRDFDRFKSELSLTGEVQAFAVGPNGVQLLAGVGTAELAGHAGIHLAPPSDGSTLALGSARGTRVEIGGAEVAADVSLSESKRTLSLSAAVRSAALVISAGDGDGFLGSILPGEGLRTNFDLGLAWSNDAGLRLAGSASLEATLPMGLSVRGVSLTSVHVGLRANDGHVEAEVSATLSASIGPVSATLDRVGTSAALSFPEQGGNLGVANLDFRFKLPSGIGLRIDAPIVSGGGFLSSEPALGRYTGALHIKIADTVELAAFGVLQNGSATQHWSLVVILAGHIPPIELGWGFRLTGLGGVLALHRRMDSDALRDAAYGISGSLDDLLFPDSPETRLPQLLSSIERFFPPATNSHVAGPMAEIEWGRGAQVNARVRAALLLQLDAGRIALYGTVRIGFPRVESDSILRIRAGLEALFDPRDKIARFSITIIEAKLFQSIQLTGGAAFFVRWGNVREFVFTIGGFHPSFRPYIPKGLVEPPRIGVHWNPVSGVRLDLSQYFAVTSTSMQFGAAAHAEVGCSWGKVTADLAYDLLVMTSPSLHLEADLHARVTLTVFGADLLSAGLDGSLIGPAPWVFSGKVTWKVWILHISKSFQFEWGERVSIPATPQSAGEILAAEMQSAANWTSYRTRALAVKVRSGVSAPLAPRDEIEVRQSQLPFNTRLETFEGNPLSDAGLWTLTPTSSSGIVKLAELTDVFPERRFLAQPSKERPFRGGLSCGARLGRIDWEISAVAIAVDSTVTDDVIVDGGVTDHVPGSGPGILPPSAVADIVAMALPTRAAARAFTRGASLIGVVQ